MTEPVNYTTTQGTVRRLHFAAPASQELRQGTVHAAGAVNARIAVLFSSGSLAVWELDSTNELRPVQPSPVEESAAHTSGPSVWCMDNKVPPLAEVLVLLQSPLTVASAASLGKVIELSWVPLPAPVGPGSMLALAMEDGSLAFVDAVQTVEQASQRQRLATFRGLLAGALPGQAQANLCI